MWEHTLSNTHSHTVCTHTLQHTTKFTEGQNQPHVNLNLFDENDTKIHVTLTNTESMNEDGDFH